MSDNVAHEVAHEAHDAKGDHSYIHVSPWQTLVVIWVALVLLTILTVWSASVDTGRFDLAIAMAIATVKCVLVMAFFMHLIYDRAMNRLLFFGSILFFSLFLGITVLDLTASKEAIDSYRIENPTIKTSSAGEATQDGQKQGEKTAPGDPTEHEKKK